MTVNPVGVCYRVTVIRLNSPTQDHKTPTPRSNYFTILFYMKTHSRQIHRLSQVFAVTNMTKIPIIKANKMHYFSILFR